MDKSAVTTHPDESTPHLPEPYDAPSLKQMNEPLTAMPTPEILPPKTISLIKTILYANVLQFSLIALICLICYECGAATRKRAARPGVGPPAYLAGRGPTTVNSSEDHGLSGLRPPMTPTPPPTPPPRNPAV